jgi:hypothetical protein
MSFPRFALILLVAVSATVYADHPLSWYARWPDLVAQAKDRGVDYPLSVTRAQRGDVQALREIFRLTPHTDGSAADSHCVVLRSLLEQLGDRPFSQALREELASIRSRVVQAIDFDFGKPWKKQFPQTYALGSHDNRLLRGGR